jgi:hypothetical protein
MHGLKMHWQGYQPSNDSTVASLNMPMNTPSSAQPTRALQQQAVQRKPYETGKG